MTIPVEEILEDLEVSRADPGPGYLERLFLRFNDRVPFETASKILRNARVSDPAAKPRTPEIFWEERLESGAGGTCFARVAAFHALLEALGFRARRVLGRVREEGDHAALLVQAGEEEWICDAGFPLPVLLPSRAGRVETGFGTLSVAASAKGFRVDFEGGVPEGPRLVEIYTGTVTPEEYAARWGRTFRSESKFLSEVVLHRTLDNRRVTFKHGSIRVDDLHSRTTLPLPSPRAPALQQAFGVDAGMLSEAFAIAGDPEPESANAAVECYLESAETADAAFAAIASPERYAALSSGVAETTSRTTGPHSWTARMAAPAPGGGAADAISSIEDQVERLPDARTLSVRRAGRTSSWSVEERDGTVWLIRRAALDGPRPDLLRNDSLRGRLAGALAVDLLAWTRRIGVA